MTTPKERDPRYAVQLGADSRVVIEKYALKTRLAKTVIVEQLLAWFDLQAEDVQRAIMEGGDVAGALSAIRLTDMTTLQGSVEKLPDLTPIQIAEMQKVLTTRLIMLLKTEASIPAHLRHKGPKS